MTALQYNKSTAMEIGSMPGRCALLLDATSMERMLLLGFARTCAYKTKRNTLRNNLPTIV